MLRSLPIVITLWICAAACDSDQGAGSCVIGELGCVCGPGDRCKGDLHCSSGVCVEHESDSLAIGDPDAGGEGDASANGGDGTAGSSTSSQPNDEESDPEGDGPDDDDESSPAQNDAGAEQSDLEVFPPCEGHEGGLVCDGEAMHECSSGAASLSMMACDSEQHCLAGIDEGRCAICLSGEHTCEGAELQSCQDGRFEMAMQCDSEALCNPVAQGCTEQACNPDQFSCDGDVSSQCNEDGSELGAGTECEHGCNHETGECNACTPSSARCDEQTRVECDEDGQAESSSTCEALCVNGECVQCTATTVDDDCEVEEECKVPSCSDGECGEADAEDGTDCSLDGGDDGYCDAGECVQCTEDTAALDCLVLEECQIAACDDGRCEEVDAEDGAACSLGLLSGLGYCEDGECEDPCGNGTVDRLAGEECDPEEAGTPDDVCDDNCQLTREIYGRCSGLQCFPESNLTYFDMLCGSLGGCTQFCTTDFDCPAGGSCVANGEVDRGVSGVCLIPCLSDSVCPNNLDCQNFEVRTEAGDVVFSGDFCGDYDGYWVQAP